MAVHNLGEKEGGVVLPHERPGRQIVSTISRRRHLSTELLLFVPGIVYMGHGFIEDVFCFLL